MSKLNDVVLSVKTKPNKVSFRIVVVGVVITVALWFFGLSPLQGSAAEAQEELEAANGIHTALSAEIGGFRSGEGFTSAQVGPAVAPVENLLPSGGTPGDAANRIRDLAITNGLTVTSVSFPNAYTAAGPNKLRADVQFDVTGPLTGLTSWLDAMTASDQLVTVTTAGPNMSGTEGTASMAVTVTVWATTLESWADGVAPAAGDDTPATPSDEAD